MSSYAHVDGNPTGIESEQLVRGTSHGQLTRWQFVRKQPPIRKRACNGRVVARKQLQLSGEGNLQRAKRQQHGCCEQSATARSRQTEKALW